MSWQIPQQIEQDIIAGKAQYRTFQTGVGGQSILPVPNNAYAVVFGYDFSPAGGGLSIGENYIAFNYLLPEAIRFLKHNKYHSILVLIFSVYTPCQC